MVILIIGLAVFFGVHSVRMLAPDFRGRQIAASEGRWKGLYSLASLVGFGLIIWGWVLYRPDAPEIYAPPQWGQHVAWAFVIVAFVLLVSAYAPPGYLKKGLRHPFLAAVILWSTGHLLANGDLASILLFGSFLVYAVINRLAVIPRGKPVPGPISLRGDVIAVVAGVVVALVFAGWIHGWLFGVNPLA